MNLFAGSFFYYMFCSLSRRYSRLSLKVILTPLPVSALHNIISLLHPHSTSPPQTLSHSHGPTTSNSIFPVSHSDRAIYLHLRSFRVFICMTVL